MFIREPKRFNFTACYRGGIWSIFEQLYIHGHIFPSQTSELPQLCIRLLVTVLFLIANTALFKIMTSLLSFSKILGYIVEAIENFMKITNLISKTWVVNDPLGQPTVRPFVKICFVLVITLKSGNRRTDGRTSYDFMKMTNMTSKCQWSTRPAHSPTVSKDFAKFQKWQWTD